MEAIYVILFCTAPLRCDTFQVSQVAPTPEYLAAAQRLLDDKVNHKLDIRVERWSDNRCQSVLQYSQQSQDFMFKANTNTKVRWCEYPN